MAKQSIAKPTRSITSALLLVALLLPVILYLCVFWRSGVFSSVSDISGFFASGTYSDAEPPDASVFSFNEHCADGTGLTVTWDPDLNQLTINGTAAAPSYLPIFTFKSDDIALINFCATISGDLGTSYFMCREAANNGTTLTIDSGSDYSLYVGSDMQLQKQIEFTFRARAMTYNNLVLRFDRLQVSRFFGDHPGIEHSPGSFGEFLCNNFTVSEVNELVARPVLYAVSSLNNGYVSPESQYNVYVICAYFTYVIFVYFVFLIVKLLTFIPCVIIKYVNKATGGDHFG